MEVRHPHHLTIEEESKVMQACERIEFPAELLKNSKSGKEVDEDGGKHDAVSPLDHQLPTLPLSASHSHH